MAENNTTCDHGEEVGVDWVNGLVLHERDSGWHPWNPAIYGDKEQ